MSITDWFEFSFYHEGHEGLAGLGSKDMSLHSVFQFGDITHERFRSIPILCSGNADRLIPATL
ncbi:MAG: hypothetical protein ACFE0O_15450, partial [Opitutales bacterium]